MLSLWEIDKIVEFTLQQNKFDGTKEQLHAIISKHNAFNTIESVWKSGEVIAVCRYNIDSNVCVVIDATVRDTYRFKRLLKLMLLTGLKKYPQTRFLKYRRGFKTRKDERQFEIARFLNIKGVQ